MQQTIEETLSMTPENMAQEQHKLLRDHTVGLVEQLVTHLNNQDYDEAAKMFEMSPAGDGWGGEHYYLKVLNMENQGSDGNDLGSVILRLQELLKQSEKKKK